MVKRCVSICLALALLLSGAALAEVVRPMGRYVESEIAPPDAIHGIVRLSSLEDGRLALLGADKEGFALFAREDAGWTTAGTVLGYDGGYSDAAARGNYAYALSEKVMRHAEGGWTPMDQIPSDLIVTAMDIAADGALIAQVLEGNGYLIMAFDPKTGAMRERYDGLDGAFTIQGDALFAVSTASSSVLQYDVTTGELLHEMEDAPIMGNDLLASDGAALYLANSGGIYRIAPGGSIWEQLVDGNLTSLRQPSMELRSMAVQDGDLYVYARKDRSPVLLRYQHDAAVSARPLYALKVYTLQENPKLSFAAARFQEQNPEYMVDVVVLLSERTGVTPDDAIRALNTELLSGKGPDLLVLDGLPLADYVEKGVLFDLGPLVQELGGAGELLSPVFDPLYRDGKLFAAPIACALPAVLGREENIQGIERLDDMIQMFDRSSTPQPIAWRTKQGYFNMFLPASYPAWFSSGGQLDEAAFGQYLASIDTIYHRAGVDESLPNQKTYLAEIAWREQNPDPMTDWIGFGDTMRMQKGHALLNPLTLGSFNDNMGELTVLHDMGGTLSWLPGQATHVYEPRSLLGVNARSGQIEAAKRLVRMALSREVQDGYAYGGLPINQQTLTALVEDDTISASMGLGASDLETGEDATIVAQWPVLALRREISAMLHHAQTPFIPDITLIGMIEAELAPFFAGEMDAQTAAQAVSAKVRAYLAE